MDAICVTEHLYVEGANVAQEIGRQVGFPVFRGVEARTDLGDMLVFIENFTFTIITEVIIISVSYTSICWAIITINTYFTIGIQIIWIDNSIFNMSIYTFRRG